VAGRDEVAQPLRRVGVELVVVGGHGARQCKSEDRRKSAPTDSRTQEPAALAFALLGSRFSWLGAEDTPHPLAAQVVRFDARQTVTGQTV
jgi:hypothetical protein